MRGAGWVDHQRLGVGDVGKVAGELDAVDELDPCVLSALDAEADDRAGAMGQVLGGVGVVGVVGQAGIVDPIDALVSGQPVRDGLGVLAVSRHPDWSGLVKPGGGRSYGRWQAHGREATI